MNLQRDNIHLDKKYLNRRKPLDTFRLYQLAPRMSRERMIILVVKIYGAELEVYGLEDVPADAFGVIYGAENLINHKIYVGQTTRSIKERFREHAKASCDTIFGKAIQKYGLENFIVVILAVCNTKEELDEQEISWITRLGTKGKNGYNQTDGGEGTLGAPGRKHTEEEKANLSAKLKGRKFTPEHKANISASNKGRVHSKSTKAKISKTLTGRKLSAERRANISAGKKGKKKSAETRKKMSIAALNRPPEHNAKISAGVKAYWARVKAKKQQEQQEHDDK